MNKKIQLKRTAVQAYQDGRLPLTRESLQEGFPWGLQEGDLFDLYVKNQFVAQAYFGLQHKGVGFVLTQDQHQQIDEHFFVQKMQAAWEKRASLASDPETNCFRLFHDQGDGVGGLQIDYFAGYLLIHWYSRGIYAFSEPILQAIKQVFPYEGIYEKRRFKEAGGYQPGDDFVEGKPHPKPFWVKEHQLFYRIDLNDGAMVGLFMDQREVRKALLSGLAKDRDVLNTFSYTGVYSVTCKKGGAKKTTSVDLANRSRQWTLDNLIHNGMDPRHEDIVVEDIFAYFRYARKKNLSFDLIILDPPSFSRSKKKTFQVERDYPLLLDAALGLLRARGILLVSTNCSTLSMANLKKTVRAACERAQRQGRMLREFTNPLDFPAHPLDEDSLYLKVLLWEVT